MSPFPFKLYSQLTPASLLLCPEVITMATRVLPGAGPSMTSPRAQPWLVLSLQVLGQTSTPGVISSQLTMWSLKWFLCFSMAVTCVVYFSEKESRRSPGEGALWRTLYNLAESTTVCPRLAWDHVALAFLHCADVHDSEVGRREWWE